MVVGMEKVFRNIMILIAIAEGTLEIGKMI